MSGEAGRPGGERSVAFSTTPDLSSLPVSPSVTPVVSDPIRCLACDYDLRGLLVSGACPECGAPIRSSIAPAFLRDVPGGYAADLRGAAGAVLWAIGFFLFAMYATVVAFFAANSPADSLFGCAAGISVCVAMLLWLGGWAIILKPGPPALRLRSSQRRYRMMTFLIPSIPIGGVILALILPGGSGAVVVAGGLVGAVLTLPLLAMLGIRQIRDLSAYVQRAGVQERCPAATIATGALGFVLLAVFSLAAGSLVGALIAGLLLPFVVLAFFAFLVRLLLAFRGALAIEIAANKGPPEVRDSRL